MKHLILPILLAAIFVSDSNAQNFVRVDESNAQEKVLVNQNQVLEVHLYTNPSTGFSWQLANPNGILKQVGDWDFISDNPSNPIGAPGTQIFHFVGMAAGTSNLEFVHARPWETNVTPTEFYTINITSNGVYTGNYTATVRPEVTVNNGNPTRALPAKFNWLEQQKMTPCKNQQSCGSCWTFAACGSFEANIKIKDGVTRDLSEQWIVNCDKTNFGCDGGWCPDDMFQTYGAVYEADEPYRSANGTCKSSYTYHEKIDSWKEIAENPTTAQIKQAILDYGPVWACVCAGNNFQNYTSGVLSASDGTEVNHAIVLCGWDDANSCWFLRNSWGSTWGENQGYMRIRYGVSNVGYKAAYLVYKGGITTGINNVADADHIRIYPNPTSDVVNISGLGKESHVEVIDLVGNTVFQENTNAASYKIDLSNNAKGMYIYKIFDGTQQLKTGKIIVE